MQRLSGLDASFLYLETRSQLMHVIGIIEIDPATVPGGYSFDKMRDELERRLRAMPAFRRKLANSVLNIDHPVWVEDTDFDIQRHVHRVAVPSPGSEREVADFCAHLAGQTLDRGKPLWELWIMEGLAGGKAVAMLRMHHAGVDGVTSADLLAQLCTPTPDPPDLDEQKVKESAGGTSRATMAAGGAVNYLLQRPLAMAKLLPATVRVPVGWLRRARSSDAMPAPFGAPRTPFNAPITPHRVVAMSQVPMSDVKKIKNYFGVKINDVVLALVAGALRDYLLRLDALPDRPLVAMVPVSVHGADEADLVTEGTNKVSGMFTELPTDVADPAERVEASARAAQISKAHHADIDANILRAWAQFAPGTTMAAAMKIYGDRGLSNLHPTVFNVLVSNVPGPDFPLYFLGARVNGVYPLGPIFHGGGLNITVFSADGHLNFGLLGCKELVPDEWSITESFAAEVATLVGLVG